MKNEKKPRLLLVLEILQKADVEHPLNTTEIINNLKQCGVDAERKAVLREAKERLSGATTSRMTSACNAG